MDMKLLAMFSAGVSGISIGSMQLCANFFHVPPAVPASVIENCTPPNPDEVSLDMNTPASQQQLTKTTTGIQI
jgi:hypothetical protein